MSLQTTSLQAVLEPILANAVCLLLRWETARITPCTGIQAVHANERQYFYGAPTIAPWQSQMSQAANAERSGEVRVVGTFELCEPGIDATVVVRKTADPDAGVVLYLDVDGHFRGVMHPYDTPPEALRMDSLVFGLAVQKLLELAQPAEAAWLWCADWETVPAGYLQLPVRRALLCIHNIYDQFLANEAMQFDDRFSEFTKPDRTALRVALEQFSVVTCVSAGFKRGLLTEPIYQVNRAPHLQDVLPRIVPVSNANFYELSQVLRDIESTFRSDAGAAMEMIRAIQQKKRAVLPVPLRERLSDKCLILLMGRRDPQKQHDLCACAIRRLLKQGKCRDAFFVFATRSGGVGSDITQNAIRNLADDFPDNVFMTPELIDYFDALNQAATIVVMCSLVEPFGGAYAGLPLPLVRAVDGLAEQIVDQTSRGAAADINRLWHPCDARSSGFTFREDLSGIPETHIVPMLKELESRPMSRNVLFKAIETSLADCIERASEVWRTDQSEFFDRIRGALEIQSRRHWLANYAATRALVDHAAILERAD